LVDDSLPTNDDVNAIQCVDPVAASLVELPAQPGDATTPDDIVVFLGDYSEDPTRDVATLSVLRGAVRGIHWERRYRVTRDSLFATRSGRRSGHASPKL
jgi:hypothetical protein